VDARVLIVESDGSSREVLEASLRSSGCRVATAADGADALQRIEAEVPDLVISETRMPAMDGFELRRRLREHEAWAGIPFIFLTEERSPEDRMRGLELGVEDYLTKPIFMQEVITRVRIALQRAQRARIEAQGAARTQFSGRLMDMTVGDLVQTVEVSRKSGIIHLEREDGARGEMYFREGKIVDAESGRLAGERALYRLLLWREGGFAIEFKTIHRRDAMTQGNQAVLLEGMRRLDEWNRLLEGLPALPSVLEVVYERLAERLGDIPDAANALLRRLDGRRTLAGAIDECDLDDLDALRAARLLCDKGIVRVIATRSPGSREPTPAPTPVAPRVAALTRRKPTFQGSRVTTDLGSATAASQAAAFSAPTGRPGDVGERPFGATTVIGHAVHLPEDAAPRAPARRPTIERSAVGRAPTPPASPAEPRPGGPPGRPQTPVPAPPQPQSPLAPAVAAARETPRPAPVIPFPARPETPARPDTPPPPPAKEPSFVRSLEQLAREARHAGSDPGGGVEDDFFATHERAETDSFLDGDLSGVRAVGGWTRGKRIFAVGGGLAALGGIATVWVVMRNPYWGTGDAARRRFDAADAARRARVVVSASKAAPVASVPGKVAAVAPTPTPTPVPAPAPRPGAAPAAPAPAAPVGAAYADLVAQAQKAYQRGRTKEASRLVDDALAQNARGDEAMALRAALALDAGKADVALQWADKALAANADNARAHVVRGVCDQEQGRAADAKAHYQRYLELEPNGDLASDVRQALREL
jgi:DNA-binding response OmpR family regulator